VAVLSELLAAGATRWACQLPGSSLTSNALDLAALGGHMQVRRMSRAQEAGEDRRRGGNSTVASTEGGNKRSRLHVVQSRSAAERLEH
jgi:hypothetical protein